MKNFAAWKLDLLDRMSTDHRLSATDFRLAYRLFSFMDAHTGACFPKQETLAADLGVTDRTVRLVLVNLRACGWLKIEERQLPKGRGRSNFYHFNDPTTGSAFPMNTTNTGNGIPHNTSTTGNSAQDFRKKESGAPYKEEHFEMNTLNRESTKCIPRDQTHPERFKPDLRVALTAGMDHAEAERQAEIFLDYYRVKGKPVRDWNAAWRNWVRRVPDFARPSEPDRQRRPLHIADQVYQEARQAYERELQGGHSDDGVEPAGSPARYISRGV
ncbi:helix-turn-helix domain-containing protein [Rhizobium ruizarguesonis]|uniref:helix-turn-helix domain-containing protein n=1 Tax=Rhizobium ruizarguesonis TaxID=2081791 RepID=UPI0010314A27|nr:helix-turn-helix domain-containing protein [Rhizobium ruizarguesonis]TBB88092.1 helix-turn-helix domain-containing protein [Rhizobium ruizarguesonis]TBC45053.1 helix-turn-helix domain-containing protein [Rhizobium ruizarguesonis]